MARQFARSVLFACLCSLGHSVEPASRPDIFGFSSIGDQETFDDDGDDVDVGDVTESETINVAHATFENARPGTCCTLQPHTHMTWSEFASSSEASANQTNGLPLVVACGTEVTVDRTITETLPGLQILGSLKFQDGVDIRMDTKYIFVCGNFSIGSPMQAHQSKVEIVLTGRTNVTWRKNNGDIEHFGHTGFVTYGGSTYLRGSACGTTTWSRLKSTIEPSNTEMELQGRGALTWQPGDKLLITTSSYSKDETEEVEVSGVNGRTITFTGMLNYSHDGCDPETQPGLECVIAAEVARLSRNIVIRGEHGCAPDCGHFMIAHTHTGHFCGVEFTNLGQTAVEGRYPFHVHLPGNAPDMVVRDNSLHHNHNRGVVLHGVHNLTVENNINYITKGHLFMLEDGVEMDNRFIGNLALNNEPMHFGCKATHDTTFKCPHRSDHKPNAFWFPNPGNIVEGNVAVGVGGAFFFEVRFVTGKVRLMFPLEARKVGKKGKIKGQVGIKTFVNNMAHSCGGGIGNYPRMNTPRRTVSTGYENFTAWRNSVGIHIHNSPGRSWPTVGARLIQNTVGLAAGTGKARFIVRKSVIVAGREGMDGTGRKITVPFIMNKLGNTKDGHVERCFADTDSYTMSWIRCFGGYDGVSQSRFHSFVWNISRQLPCDALDVPSSPLKYVPSSNDVPVIEGYNFEFGWIGGHPGGNRNKYTFAEAIEICTSMGDPCSGITCDTIEYLSTPGKNCTLRERRWVGRGQHDVTVSYLKDPDFVFTMTTTPAPVHNASTLWIGATVGHHCPFYRWQQVSNQWECQDACGKFALCTGISYSPSNSGFSSDCYMCRENDLVPNANSFDFFPRPGGSRVEVVAGYTFEEGWLGGFARGNQDFFSLDDAIDKCNEYGEACGGVSCTPNLFRCTVRAQRWLRGGSDTLAYVKASTSADASSYKVSGSISMDLSDTSFMNSPEEKEQFEKSIARTIVNVTALNGSSLFIDPEDITVIVSLARRLKVATRELSQQGVNIAYTVAVSGSMMEARAEIAQEKVAVVESGTMLNLLSQNLGDVMGPSQPTVSSFAPAAQLIPLAITTTTTSTTSTNMTNTTTTSTTSTMTLTAQSSSTTSTTTATTSVTSTTTITIQSPSTTSTATLTTSTTSATTIVLYTPSTTSTATPTTEAASTTTITVQSPGTTNTVTETTSSSSTIIITVSQSTTSTATTRATSTATFTVQSPSSTSTAHMIEATTVSVESPSTTSTANVIDPITSSPTVGIITTVSVEPPSTTTSTTDPIENPVMQPAQTISPPGDPLADSGNASIVVGETDARITVEDISTTSMAHEAVLDEMSVASASTILTFTYRIVLLFALMRTWNRNLH